MSKRRKKKNNKAKDHPQSSEADDIIQQETMNGETMVSLTPQGRMLWESVLAACSQHAGRPVSGEEITAVIRKMRDEMNVGDVDFRNPEHMEWFKKEIALLGGQ